MQVGLWIEPYRARWQVRAITPAGVAQCPVVTQPVVVSVPAAALVLMTST